MKKIGLNISIGAKVSDAVSKLSSLSSKTSSVSKTIEKLSAKKIDLIANDKNVLKVGKELTELSTKLENLQKRKTKLSLQLDTKKVNSINIALSKVKSDLKTLERKERKLELEIKTTTDEKQLKKLNKSLESTRKKIISLSSTKIGLDEELAKTKEANKRVNEKLTRTKNLIGALNSKKITLDDELKNARTEAEKTNKTIGKIGRTIEKINATKLKIQQTVERRDHFKQSAVTNVARVATVAMPIKTGIEFESSMARVKAITMATDTEFKALESTALKLGSTTTFSSSQVAEGMQYLSMAGFKTNQTIKAMPGVLNLASAGAVDLATTSDIASNVLSGFKIKAEKMGMVADVMAKAITTANVDVQSIGETMKYAATPAQSLGDSIQTVTALTGKLGDIGIKGSEAGTALRSMYLRMASPPKEAAKVVEKLGLKLKDSKGNFLGMINVLKQLNNKTKGMGNTVKSDYMKKLFGTEAVSAAIALTDKADGTLKKYVTTLEKSTGFSQKMADIQNNTTAGALKRFSSAIEGISIKFSKIFTPAIKVVADKLAGFSTWLGEMSDKYPKLTKYVVVGTTALLAGGVALGALGIAAGLASNGIRVLSLSFMSNPIGIAIGVIAGGAALIYANWEGISSWFSSKWESVKGIFSSTWSSIKSGLSISWNGIKMLFNWSPIGIITNNWQPILGFFTGIGNGIKNLFSIGWNGLKSALSWNPLDFVMEKWNKLSNFFSNFSLKDAGSKIISSVVDGMTATWGKLTKKVGDITKSIRDFFPFSPAKRGALTDIHKIKLMETVASSINDKPLLKAVNNTTFKVRKQLALAGAGVALSGSLAVAQPTIKSVNMNRGGAVAKINSERIIENISKENIVRESFSTTTNTPATINQTVTVNFSGETHIHNNMDKEQFMAEVEARVKEALYKAQQDQISKRLYD
jgi:TP901 family phage tail tape measure protein